MRHAPAAQCAASTPRAASNMQTPCPDKRGRGVLMNWLLAASAASDRAQEIAPSCRVRDHYSA